MSSFHPRKQGTKEYGCSVLLLKDLIVFKVMAMNEEGWSCSACTFANHPDLISCEICGTDRSDNHPGSPSISSQEQILKTAAGTVSSAPFVPKDSPSHKQEADKRALSGSSAKCDPSASAALPKTLSQQEADKKSLSVSSSPYDPSWRERLWGSSTLPGSTTTSTSTSSTQQDSSPAHGSAAAMMPDVYHHPANMMYGNGMIPPPMSMPGYDMPVMSVPGQVYNRYSRRDVSSVPPSNAFRKLTPLIYSTATPSNLLSSNLPLDRWDTIL